MVGSYFCAVHLKDSGRGHWGHFLSIVSVDLKVLGGVCILKWHILILFTVNIFKCDCF